MPIVIEQYFLTGKFHSTRWNQSPFEDAIGEWPPSPWRLLRALTARAFEHARETGNHDDHTRDSLLIRLAETPPLFRLPTNPTYTSSWPARGVKQYQPTDLVKSDKKRGEPWVLRPQTTLFVDSFVCLPPDDPIYWIWPKLNLSPDETALLARLLRRVTYFGRAESLTVMRLLSETRVPLPANCELRPEHGNGVPVLVADPSQNVDIIKVLKVLLANNDDRLLKGRRIPPGTAWWHAVRPTRHIIRQPRVGPVSQPLPLLQFAIGGRVFPSADSWIRITERFRGAVLDTLAKLLTGRHDAKFSSLSPELRLIHSLMTGKGSDGIPSDGHLHPFFWLLPSPNGYPERLVCYRRTPFNSMEQEAMLIASERNLSWQFGNPDWVLRMVPLSEKTPLPHAILGESRFWKTVTHYVPTRHVLGRKGKPRAGNSIIEQVLRDLTNAGFPPAKIGVMEGTRKWVKIHRPMRLKTSPINDLKLGYHIYLEFDSLVRGPISLGNSSHFGLGLFAGVDG